MASNAAPVYVIGHKNPDTDSICSAIAYAELKNILHGGGYCAARAGQINQETQYVLNFFQVSAPKYVGDVMTDIRDIEIRKTQGVSGQISLKKAWNMMRALGVVTLPITDNQRLQGLITIGDIANAYMEVYDNRSLSAAKTSYKNIIERNFNFLEQLKSDNFYEKFKRCSRYRFNCYCGYISHIWTFMCWDIQFFGKFRRGCKQSKC